MKLSIWKYILLAAASLFYLALGIIGIIFIPPVHSSVILLIFTSSVLVIPVCLMWRDILRTLCSPRSVQI